MENTEEIYTDFARVYDELMDNTPYEMWCNRLDQLIASYGVSRPTRDAEGILDSERNLVVDLGCGTGTLTELLYQKGYDCIGVDNSEEMLGIAMEKKVESGSEILYLHQDMRELDLYSGKYAAGTYYLLFCKKSTGMGCGQAGHRQVLYLLPGKRT